MTPEVLDDDRERSELALGRPEELRPGAAAPAAGRRRRRAERYGPGGDEAAEMVDPRQVDELERAAEPLGPPAVPLCAVRRPAVERVAPQLAVRG